MKNKKDYVTPKWLEIKKIFEEGTNGNPKYGENFPIGGELDIKTREMVDLLGELTRKFGAEAIIEGVSLNLWKERNWAVVENAGLLAEIAWKEELINEELELNNRDDWYEDSDDLEIDLDDEVEVIKFVQTSSIISDPDEVFEEEEEI